MDIASIIEQIPALLQFIVPGYLFISLYSFTTYSKQEFESKITASIGISFILKVLFDLLNNVLTFLFGTKFGTNAYFLGLLGFCLVCAYFCARVSDSEFFKGITSKLGIKRTINKNIWADAIRPGYYLEIYLNEPERLYYGQVEYVEENADNPWIVLSNYYVIKPSDEKSDHRECQDQFAMLNAGKASRIKIVRTQPQKKKK